MTSNNDELVERFRLLLTETAPPSPEPGEQVDLFSLFSELSGLKNEVRIEGRQLKSALDDFRSVFTALQGANQSMSDKLERDKQNAAQIQALVLKPVLLQLLDLYDRLFAGLQLIGTAPAPPSLFARFAARERAQLAAFREAQEMTLAKLTDILLAHEVRAMEVLGTLFNPQIMRAVGTDWCAEQPEGEVTAEVRKGFYWGDITLRLAEVKINKENKE